MLKNRHLSRSEKQVTMESATITVYMGNDRHVKYNNSLNIELELYHPLLSNLTLHPPSSLNGRVWE